MASLAPLLTMPSAAQTASNVSPTISRPLAVTAIAVDVNVTAAAGTSPTLEFYVDRLGTDGVWYEIWNSAAITAAGPVSTSIGPGCVVGAVLTGSLRLRWTVGGTTPSFTFSASIVGQ